MNEMKRNQLKIAYSYIKNTARDRDIYPVTVLENFASKITS